MPDETLPNPSRHDEYRRLAHEGDLRSYEADGWLDTYEGVSAFRLEGFDQDVHGPGEDIFGQSCHVVPPCRQDLVQLMFYTRDLRDYWLDYDTYVSRLYGRLHDTVRALIDRVDRQRDLVTEGTEIELSPEEE